MDQVVTLNWLNCLCDSSRRAKLRKLTDTSVIDHLLELLVKFQFCTPNCAKFSKEDKKQLIVKFLITKVKDYNSSRLFIDDESVLVACWIFLFHIVWSLEDATLRNHLSFHLDNASQEFIKAFLESIQVQSEINENIVAKCLNRAKEKCAHLDFERSPKEFVSHSSNNSTPNNQTPTGIKRKMSLTLREFLMSPNSQKKFVEEHTKELKRLKIELNNEISEKVEVMEENDQLKQRVDQLSKQLDVKLGENQRLRREIEMMECNLIEANSTVKSSGNEREFSDLRIRLDELRSYASSLEIENASISEQLSTKQKDIISITEECETLKKQFDELHLTLISKEEVIHRLSKDKEFFKVEMNNLKEFNQDLSEKIAVLESARVNLAVESNAPNLESELQFQLMKDTIEWAKKNMSVIETEQTRLMNENRSLNERVKNLVDEKKEIDSTLKDLNSRIDTLKTENIALKNSKENLSKKLKHVETKLLNTNRDFESYKTQNESSTKKLIDEKEHLQHEMYALKQSLDQYARITDELSSREEYLVADNKSLVAKLENTKEHLSRNETLLEDFNAQMEHLKSENLKLSMKLNDLESQNKTANAKLTEVSKEKTKLLKNREEMEKKLAKNKETIESLVKQTSQEQDRCKELTKMVEVHMKKIEQSENSLKKLEEDRVDLNKRINIQNEELKLTETRYQYEAEAHAIAKNKLAALEKINVDQKSVNKQLETDLKSKQYENKTLVCKIKELEEYLQQTEHVNKKLKISLDELIKEKERITTKYSDLERKSNIDHSVIQSLTDQSTRLQNQNTDLERKIQTLTEQTNSDGEIIQVLQNDNTKLADKLKDISAEFKVVLEESAEKIKREKQLEESISQLREESSTLKTSLEKVNSEKQTVCDKLVELTHQHENLFNKRINLIESLKSFETLVPSLNEEIVGLRTEVNQLTGTNESLKNQLVELTSQMQLVEAEKLATTTQYDSLVQQLQNLENTYADMIKNKQQLEKFNVERQNMIESLQNDLKSASALNSQLNEKLQCLEKETSHLRGKLDDYEEKSKSLQDTVVQLEAANQRLSADCDVLVKQKKLECDEYELKIAALNEDILGIRDQLEKMNEINETQLHNLESTQSTLQQTQIEKENFQKENSALIEEKHRIDLDLKNETIQVEKLEDKIAELEKLFGDQTNEMKLLKSDYTRTNEDNQRLNDRLKDFENNICEIQERLKASVQEAETLDSEKKSLLRKIVDFEHSFDELQRQNLTLLKNVQDVTTEKQTIAVEKEDLVKRTKDSDEIIKKLNSEIVGLQNRIDKLSDENKWYEDQLKLTEIALTSVKEQKREFEGKYEKIYEELIDIQSQHQTTKENNSKLQFKIAQLEEANDNQKIQIEKLEQNLSNEAAKLSDVERKLSTTIEQRDTEALEIKNENDRLSEENKTYLDKVKRFEELQSERESLLCTLEQKESKLNEITSRWQVEFDTMRNERSRDAAKIAELLEDCKTQQEMVSALTKELTELQNCYEELNENKSRAMNELRDMFLHQIDQLLSNNETLQNENTKLHESNKEKVWYLNEMRKRISPIIDALEEHEKKLLQLKERNDALTKEIDECNGNKWTLKSQNEQLAVLVAQTDIEKERLNKEIQNLKDEKEILRFKTDELKLDNEEIKNDNNRIRKLMRKESSEHEELRKRSEILNENVEKMRQETEKLSMENSKLKQYLQQLERDHDKQLEIKNTEIDVVKTSIKDLQSELEILRSKHVDLSKCNEKLIEERNATLNQKITFEQDNMKLRRRLEEITAQKNEVYTMNEMNSKALENRIQSLISQNDGQLVTIQNLRGENEVLRSEIESTRTNAVASTRKQVEKLEKKIDDLTTTNAQRDELHKKEIESLSEVNHRLQVNMEKQTSLNKSLEIKLANYETLVSEKDALTKRVDELKVKLDESLEQNERITDKMNLIADKNTALVKENENLLAKMEELETKVDNLNDTVISKDKEIFLLQDEYRIFKDEYRKLSEHKSELDKDWKETLINNFKSATAQCDELNEKNRKLTEEIAENRSTITALEAEIEQIKENSTKLDETRVIASGSDNKTNLILKEENQKLIAEVQNMKKKMLQMKAFLDKEKENYRQKSEKVYSSLTTKIEAEFSDKLERAKSEYNKLIQQKYSMKEIEWKKKEENYQKMLRKEKEHIKELSSQLWNMSDKYLSLRQNVESGGPSNDFRRYSVDNFFSPGTLSRRSQSATHLNMMDAKFPKPLDFDRRLSTMSEDIQFHTKNKKPLALISGKKFSLSSAKVFPTEDEEMEIFDNACLADLKRGRMADDSDFNKQRLSVLQARNSLCPPHLKSSYPAETQFLPLQEFKENDIKMGLSGCDINEHSDIENLLPGDRTKKNRNQTSYKKPGPPTPSKHGGRASTIGVETPRNVLKESNDNGTARRKSFTPRLFNIFPIRGHATVTSTTSHHNQDENPSVTPKRNRLQSLRRRFSKNPQELGNTNSGFS